MGVEIGLGDITVFSHDTVFFPIPLSRYKCQDTAIFVAHAQYVYSCRPLPANVVVSLVSHGGRATNRSRRSGSYWLDDRLMKVGGI